ncbi:RNA polymerase sigma factor [Spirochaeta cellobiosiphila]|uniref:RNA polymerase sigma factor n=1 Tax=Spirochaeta cellobiosiphila TaxID=504483 RepID=UPI0003F9FDC1|nr:RNA polymerase sigma factor [Spirochaeta cellobiosiphila]
MSDVSVFEKIYRDNYSLLNKVAIKICGDQDVGEEVVQEAFIKYYERMESLPQGKEALYWLIRVVKNLSLNKEKRKGRERRAYERYFKEPKKDSKNEGEENTLKDETKEIVKEALLKLPHKLRTILILREYAGFSYQEIADSLHISEGNVKVRMFRARKQLADLIDQGEVYVP